MESTLHKIEPNNYELTVELGKEDLTGYVDQAEEQISKDIQIDGFRKGKAPRDVIRKKVGDHYILETALDIALQDSLSKTIEKERLEVLKVSNLSIKENSGTKLLYTVNVSVFPAIAMGDLSKLKVKRKEVKVGEEELNNALEMVVNSRAKFITKDGPIEKGNRAEIDFEITSEGLPIEGGVSKNHPVTVGDGRFVPGFEDQLLGMKAGEDKKFSLKIPADYVQKSIAGKELDFSVKVALVERIEKPALNDEFARTLGRFKDLEELKENLKEGLLEENKHKEKQRLRLEVLSQIAERSKMEISESMIKEQLDNMIQGFDQELHQKGMELSIYLAHLNKTEDDLRKDWKKEAEKQVRLSLVLKKIAREKNLKPSDEEVNLAAEKMVQGLVLRGDVTPEQIDLNKLKGSIINEMTTDKTLDFLEENYTE